MSSEGNVRVGYPPVRRNGEAGWSNAAIARRETKSHARHQLRVDRLACVKFDFGARSALGNVVPTREKDRAGHNECRAHENESDIRSSNRAIAKGPRDKTDGQKRTVRKARFLHGTRRRQGCPA